MKEQYINELNKYGEDFGIGVVSQVNKTYYQINNDNELYKGILTGRFKYMAVSQSEYPVVGDVVIYRSIDNSDQVVIEKVCDRYSKISRLGVGTKSEEQLFASNIDIAFICLSLNEDFRIKKLRNFLSLVTDKNIEVIVLLTKSDLCENQEYYVSQVKEVTSSKIMITSIMDESVLEIEELIKEKTGVFIGSSGVGKSSIVNSLIGQEYLKVNDIRTTDDQGRHTTSHRELIVLPNGGKIIDTPGIRLIYNYDFSEENEMFKNVFALEKECKFNDCKHESEPGCKVQEGLMSGELTYEEFEAYLRAKRFQRFSARKERIRQKMQNKKRH